ncbi:MAG: helix-turn-helix domain containing protein [Ramlibacter sp.]|uniref:TetR/AcrR family transcriptional regulator n=1 Tax=Ramlibacter sp. TaxID=1917967 RepID=UPI00261DA7D4|nr:TetR/AcrR family transcriptional regulator [Ramlibacter sp.]MDH4378144.1 helix-turn-helix domain containing protein [Ramlibacter sp.]
MPADPQDLAPKLGLRERNKLDKLTRIRRAALVLFESKGFDATTTREIAEAADVGIGTVFMYADDKRDLLFLIFNDVLDKVVDTAFDAVDTRQSLSAQVTSVFSHFYQTLHARVPLARILLRELVFFSEGKQAGQYLSNRRRILEGLERLTREAIARGMVRASEDPTEVAKAFFFLYSGEVRVWLTEAKPDLDAGLTSLHRTFALLARGLGETP